MVVLKKTPFKYWNYIIAVNYSQSIGLITFKLINIILFISYLYTIRLDGITNRELLRRVTTNESDDEPELLHNKYNSTNIHDVVLFYF